MSVRTLILTLFLGSWAHSLFSQQTLILNTPQDTRILLSAPNSNYGGGVEIATYNNAAGNTQRSLLKFDFSSYLNSSSTFVSATLSLYTDTQFESVPGLGSNPSFRPIDIYRASEAWTVSQVTWNDASTGVPWTTAGGVGVGTTGALLTNPYATSTANTPTATYMDWDISTLTREWINQTYANNGLLIISDAAVGQENTFQYNSTETGANPPKLTITYYPTLVVSSTVASLTTSNSTTSTFFLDGTSPGIGAGTYSKTTVAGAVTLNGGTLKPQTSFVGSTGFTPAYGQSFNLITGTSVTGSYSAIDNSANPSSLKFIAEYKNTQVNVFATPGDYSRDVANLSSSQKSVGKALNGVVTSSVNNRSGVVQSDREKITNALMRLSTPQLQTAIAQMDPTNLQGMSQSVLQGSQMLQSGFRGRLDQLQAGTQGGVTINGMSLTNLQGDYEYELVADMEIPYLVKRQRRLASYWINGTGSWGDVENEAQNSGYQFYGMGSQVGMDYTLANDWTVGLMLWEGYERSSLAMRDSLLKSHRGGGGFYAHKEWRGFYWGGYAGAGKVFYETDRSIDFLAERATGETEGVLLQGWNELGYEMRWKNWGFGPTLGVGFNRIMIDGYQETGSSAALQLDDQTQDSLSHQLGFRVQSFWKWLGIGIQPSLRMSWDHEYLTPKEMNSKFVAGGEWFQSSLRELDRETMGTRIGLTLLPDDHWSVTTSYQTQLLATQYSAHSVDLGVRYGF